MKYEHLIQILKIVYNFLDSNFFQTVVMVVTVYVTVLLYQKQLHQKEKDVAATILLQIDSICQNTRSLTKNLADNQGFDIDEMWSAVKVFDENYWIKQKQVLLRHMSEEQINVVDNYYKCASVINEQIQAFHNIIYATYENFYLERKMKLAEEIENERPEIRTFGIHQRTLRNNCNSIMELYLSTTLKNTLKILEQISCSNYSDWRKKKWLK